MGPARRSPVVNDLELFISPRAKRSGSWESQEAASRSPLFLFFVYSNDLGAWPPAGVLAEGRDLLSLPEREMREVRGARISPILAIRN